MTRRRPHLSSSARFAVLERAGFRCEYCGLAAPDATLHVDHVVPVIAGGTNDLDNLVAACSACNAAKAGRTLRPGHSRERVQLLRVARPSPSAPSGSRLDGALAELVAALREELVHVASETRPVRLLSVRDAAIALGLGRTSFYQLLGRGHIRHFRVGRRVVIPQTAIDEYVAGRMGDRAGGVAG